MSDIDTESQATNGATQSKTRQTPSQSQDVDGHPNAPEGAPNLSRLETKKLVTRYWDESQEHIRALEEQLHAKVIVLYFRTILSSSDVEYIFQQVDATGHQERIAVLLKGPGGSIEAAGRLVFMLRKYCDELIFVVPSQAASACTIMALGGDKILMGPLSALSPIDTKISNHPLAPKDMDGYPVAVEITEIQKFIELCQSTMLSSKVDGIKESPYGLLSEYVHPVLLGAIQRSLSLSKLITTDVLKTHMQDEGRINYIVDQLNDAFPDHGYPIVLEKAQQLGIQAEAMSSETHEIAASQLNTLQLLMRPKSDEDQDEKYTYTVDSVFETRDWRSVFFMERKYNLVDGVWKSGISRDEYKSYRMMHEPNGKDHIEEVL